MGGAATINQFLKAGLIDELRLHVVPVTLGAGERLFEGVGTVTLEPLSSRTTALVTHLQYRVVHD
jgi:dihydrofolate reductase